MTRLVWLAAGVLAGAVAVRRVQRAVRKVTPPALVASAADAARGVAAEARAFAAEVRAGMAEREAELRVQLGLDEAEGREA